MSEPFIGEIRMVGFNFAPLGWALCNGQLLPISQYDALFALIGTTYGGNGQTTFALPNLAGRIPLHQGQGAGLATHLIGETGGQETVTLLSLQMPSHTHAVRASATGVRTQSPAGQSLGSGEADIYTHDTSAAATLSASAVGTYGNSQPHDNMQPFMVVNFVIALEGIFPSRN